MVRTLMLVLVAATTLAGCIVVPAHGWRGGYYGHYRGGYDNYYSDGRYEYYRGRDHHGRGHRGRW